MKPPISGKMLVDIAIFDEAIALASANADKAVENAACVLSLRRRIQSALDLLAQGRLEEAKQMLETALTDNGAFIKRRIDRVMEEWRVRHPD